MTSSRCLYYLSVTVPFLSCLTFFYFSSVEFSALVVVGYQHGPYFTSATHSALSCILRHSLALIPRRGQWWVQMRLVYHLTGSNVARPALKMHNAFHITLHTISSGVLSQQCYFSSSLPLRFSGIIFFNTKLIPSNVSLAALNLSSTLFIANTSCLGGGDGRAPLMASPSNSSHIAYERRCALRSDEYVVDDDVYDRG
mmetsp:Transcript_42922/g.90128  ORF Transcript_42922/g.90128 Transcript_42922/m.90128 type:complete len:198 (-) Transcript_42922:1465-2058(-)